MSVSLSPLFTSLIPFHPTRIIASYLPLITHLRKLLRKKQTKSYTISVGKLNPAKLANFMEVECFIYVACGEGAIVVGDKVGLFLDLFLWYFAVCR